MKFESARLEKVVSSAKAFKARRDNARYAQPHNDLERRFGGLSGEVAVRGIAVVGVGGVLREFHINDAGDQGLMLDNILAELEHIISDGLGGWFR